MNQHYKAANPDDLILHVLDMMSLIYHKPSGITHIVADPVPAILEAMQSGAKTAVDIVKILTKNYELEEGADVKNIVIARLEELDALGLVEKVSD